MRLWPALTLRAVSAPDSSPGKDSSRKVASNKKAPSNEAASGTANIDEIHGVRSGQEPNDHHRRRLRRDGEQT